jgi:hypothetical protein
MARPSPYDDKTKQAIIHAALNARAEGKKWGEAYEAAKGEGFKGGLQYLVKMIRGSGAKGARRGRRPGRKPGPRAGRPAASVGGAGLGSIETIVNRMVEARVGAAVSKAVAALERAAQELKRL